MPSVLSALLLLPLLAALPDPDPAEDPASPLAWPAWRGPTGNGVSPDGTPPVAWSEEKNLRWKVAVPGHGCSTPVGGGDRLYLTTAIETDEEGEPPPAPRGRGEVATHVYDFAVLCLDRATGATVWKTTAIRAVPHEGIHPTASQASNSPVTDGEYLYAYFGSRGMHCLDLEGRVVWSRQLGLMQTRNGFGEGSSPALRGDLLVITWDHEGDSFIVALDKRTGEERWRQGRDEPTSWSSPRIVPVGDRHQVIQPAAGSTVAYDLEEGTPLWTLSGMTKNCTPTALYGEGMVFLMSGFRGAALQAVRLEGAKGNLLDTDRVLWTHDRGTPYVPSGVLYGGNLYFLRGNAGLLSCLDARTGEVRYEEARLEGVRTVYASLLAADGRIYVASREGVVAVVAAGPEFRVLATNHLDDGFDASPVAIGDALYLRGARNLYCLGETE